MMKSEQLKREFAEKWKYGFAFYNGHQEQHFMTELDIIIEAVIAEKMKDIYPKEFIEWFTGETSPVAILYGNQAERFATTRENFTIDELFNYWKENEK